MSEYEYKCGKHGVYEPDFERDYDGEICPRIMCLECEKESMDDDPNNRPKDIPYFVNGDLAVILGEAHRLSGVWKFHPPVVYPEFTFAEDLSPVLPEGGLTSEEIMARMEEMLPQIEEMVQNGTINVPDPRDLLILPGKDFSGRPDES
jgi:hypothetical protein